jgi:8-amino-7-oxononanoate synthase
VTTLDFTSALYLGLRHPSRSLRPWERLSAGAPAALTEPPGARAVTAELAALPGCAAATLAPSTLHLFWDLFEVLGRCGDVCIHLDSHTYPVARWGVERMACRGVPARRFRHHDPDALCRAASAASAAARGGRRPLVVTDGFCPACGRAAPLPAYLEIVRGLDGLLIIDDTQALGVLGAEPRPGRPYGGGGGGSLRWHGISGPEILVGASLAKGFGAPVAALSGAPELIERFESGGETRVHCSPPSAANLRAAEHALAVNRRHGEALRHRLARAVTHFRARLSELGLPCAGGLFPVQTLADEAADAVVLHGRLRDRGVRAVLHTPRAHERPRLSFLITAAHRPSELDGAADALAAAVRIARPGRRRTHEYELDQCVEKSH